LSIKLRKGEVEETTKDALVRFRNGIKSKVTLQKYERKLKILVCQTLEEYLIGNPEKREVQKKERLASGDKKKIEEFLDADFPQRVQELVERAKQNPDWAENVFMAYSAKLKERTQLEESHPDYLNPQSFSNYFKAPKKLFNMNNVRFSWDTIDATFPEHDNDNETRGYDIEEIRKMIEFANPLEKAVICLLSSSGIRRGGLDFTWNCIIPIYRRNDELVMGTFEDENDSDLVCGMVTIYRKSSEQYFAFFTPETWNAIKNYQKQWKNDTLRNPKDSEPFMKKVGSRIIPLTPDGLANRFYKIAKLGGIRTPLTDGKRRYDVPIVNGFRRFFNKINKETISKDSPLAALIKKEMMLSHTGLIQLDKNYFKTHWKELVEEYLNAVPALTISSEERTKAENYRLREEKSNLEKKNSEFAIASPYVKDLVKLLEANPTLIKKMENFEKFFDEKIARHLSNWVGSGELDPSLRPDVSKNRMNV